MAPLTFMIPVGFVMDEDAIDPQGVRNLPNAATGETTFRFSQSDLCRVVVEFPGISRTFAYTMGRTQPVGSTQFSRPGGVRVDHKEDKGTKREAAEPGISRDRACVAEGMRDAARQHTNGVARHENGRREGNGGRTRTGSEESSQVNILGRGGSDSQRSRGRNEDRRKLGGYLREEGTEIDQLKVHVHEELAGNEADDPSINPSRPGTSSTTYERGYIKLMYRSTRSKP